MNIKAIFESELINQNTNYFILDTNGTQGEYGDIDYISYDWSPSRFNKVNEGDLFLYRRPSKASELKMFYFFGAGKIAEITKIGEDRVRGRIEKPLSFQKKLLPSDLSDYNWKFKKRGDTWEHFFNQYGMNKISRDDFFGVLSLAYDETFSINEMSDEIDFIQQLQRKKYSVEDTVSPQKKRVGHKAFADQVKLNYGYKCAITGIQSREFLVASHIIPWAKDKENRLNPHNGICLSVLIDKAFDKGYIQIDSNFKVVLSDRLQNDEILLALLKPYENKKIKLPKFGKPDQEYLEWHRINIFKK